MTSVLEDSPWGYCMYCYSRVRVDGKLYAHLEHAIEKANSDKLIECIPDIGLSCSVCNQTFKKETLALQYDILRMEFQPASNFHTYSENERNFINIHINRFRLNDPRYRTRELYNFIQNVIKNNGRIPQYEYNNLIVEQFCKQIKEKSSEEILKICKSIFSIVFLKM